MTTKEPTVKEALRRIDEGEEYAVKVLENLSLNLSGKKIYIGNDPCDRNTRFYLINAKRVKRVFILANKKKSSDMSLKKFRRRYGPGALKNALYQIQKPVEAWQIGYDDELI